MGLFTINDRIDRRDFFVEPVGSTVPDRTGFLFNQNSGVRWQIILLAAPLVNCRMRVHLISLRICDGEPRSHLSQCASIRSSTQREQRGRSFHAFDRQGRLHLEQP